MEKILPLVTIVIVNYNGRHFLDKCFKSITNLNYPKNKLELILVDTCSTDDSLEFIKTNYPEVKRLKNDTNNYCRANNLGIKNASGEFIAFINNDIEIDKNWLIELIKFMLHESQSGITGGKNLFENNKIQSTGIEVYPNYYWGDRGFKFEDDGQFKNIEEIFSLCGAAMLVRKKCFDEIGLFDEDFIMYSEDIDLCLRCVKKKWKIFYVPDAIAHHNFHGTSSIDLVTYFSERNRLLVLAKHFPDKLADMLYGKGYFFENRYKNKETNIYDIFPVIIKKLFASHEKEYVDKLLPDIFKNLKYIVNLEKSSLNNKLEELLNLNTLFNAQINKKNTFISIQESSIAQLNAQINEKNTFISGQESSISQLNAQIERMNQTILELTIEKETKNTELKKAKDELSLVRNDLNKIIKVEKPISILVIKPYRICVEDVETTIKTLKQKYLNASIHLFANLSSADYDKLLKDININKIHLPKKNKFSLPVIIKFLFIFFLKRFDMVFILSAPSDKLAEYKGYKKAKLMALLIFAKTRHVYYTN